MTHTYVELEVSKPAYDEIAGKLREAGYDHVFMEDGTIDMHGIGLTRVKPIDPTTKYLGEWLKKNPLPDDFLTSDLRRRLRALAETLQSLRWHVINNTGNEEVILGLVDKAIAEAKLLARKSGGSR